MLARRALIGEIEGLWKISDATGGSAESCADEKHIQRCLSIHILCRLWLLTLHKAADRPREIIRQGTKTQGHAHIEEGIGDTW